MGWAGGAEKLGFDEGLLSDNEVRSWDVSSISWTLIMELSLGDGSLEFLMKFIEIDN